MFTAYATWKKIHTKTVERDIGDNPINTINPFQRN